MSGGSFEATTVKLQMGSIRWSLSVEILSGLSTKRSYNFFTRKSSVKVLL